MRDPAEELDALESCGLRRDLRKLNSPQSAKVDLEPVGQCLNFSSNDYLGLANSEILKEHFAENVRKFGAGSGASRLICGTQAPHLDLEEQLASLKRSEAALTFSSGFAAATGAIPALCGKEDVIILDKLCHASLIDGARLSGATLRIFPHNDLNKLESHLKWAETNTGDDGRILVVTESVFSMDGDLAPLQEIVELKSRHNALLLVDEAHAFGVIGPQGRGLAAELELETGIDFQMGTFSKAAGLSGGYVCATRSFVDLLINRARSFIYSTAPPPSLAATIQSTLKLIAGNEGDQLRIRLWNNVSRLNHTSTSAILPLIIGGNEAALRVAAQLLERGFLVPAIRYPTVPKGTARLRVTVSAAHGEHDIAALRKELDQLATI